MPFLRTSLGRRPLLALIVLILLLVIGYAAKAIDAHDGSSAPGGRHPSVSAPAPPGAR